MFFNKLGYGTFHSKIVGAAKIKKSKGDTNLIQKISLNPSLLLTNL